MKAAYYERNGGPKVLQFGELPMPEVRQDTVLIRTAAISIEGGDLLNRLMTPPPHIPFICGYQAAGIVEQVGSNFSKFKPGDEVIGFNWHGSHAEFFAVPEHYCYPVPEGMDLKLASTIPVAFGTASDALFEFGQLKSRETVLIQGAAGGVGIAATQLAAQAGCTVIGTASSTQRLERLKDFGLDHGIDYTSQDIAQCCKDLTDGRGVDLVIDLAGGRSTDALLNAVRYRGRFAVVGAAAGELPSFGFFELVRHSLHVFGVSFGREMHTQRAHDLISDISARLNIGALQMPIAAEFALREASEAHRFVAEDHPFGRVLLIP